MTSEGERVSDYQIKSMDVSLSGRFFVSNCVPAADSLGIAYPESGKSGMAVWRKTVRNWRGRAMERWIDVS
jgi:hypothetical protein